MIVICEGCETSFHVDDRLIKSTGSKVRCSKCRHVFVAYPSVAALEAEEPLVLSDELPDADAGRKSLEQRETDSELGKLFQEDAFGEDADAAETEPELPDLSGILSEEPAAADAIAAEKLGDDLDLELDFGLEDDQGGDKITEDMLRSVAQESPEGGSEEIEIDFNLDFEPSDEMPTIEDLPTLEGDELNLEEVNLLDGPETAGEAAVDAAADVEGSEVKPDLDAEFLDLVEADTKDTAAEEQDLEASLQEVSDGTEAGSGLENDQVSEMDLELEAALDEKGPAASGEVAADAGAADEDELDLSDLEALLDSDGAAAAKTPDGVTDIDLNLDLESVMAEEGETPGDAEEIDFNAITAELETDVAPADSPSGAEPGEKTELDLEAGERVPQAADLKTDELDFSEITAMLEEEEPPAEALKEAAPADDPGLLFEEETEAALQPSTPEDGAQDSLMLDIETLLEDDAEEAAEAVPTDSEVSEEIELDLAGEPAPAAAEDIEIEIEPVSEDTEAGLGVAAAATAAAVTASSAPTETEDATTDFAAEAITDAGLAGETDVLETEDQAAAVQETAAPRRSGFRKMIVAVLGLFVLAVAAILIPRSLGIHIPYLSDVNIPYLSELDIEIPFIGKLFQSEPVDTAGNLKISPLAPSITAEFVNNSQAGKLCVIKGMVKNSYDHPRSFIQVTGKLYTKDKKMAKSVTGYAGTVLNNEELTTLDFAAISGRLKSKNGIDNRNVGVKPGATVPFMLVFDQLPNNLDEYSVEVASSSK